MATPHVSGALAILLSQGRSPADAIDRLLATAVDLGPEGPDETFGAGRLDLAAAVDAAIVPASRPSTTTTAAVTATVPTTAPAPPVTTTSPPPTAGNPSTSTTVGDDDDQRPPVGGVLFEDDVAHGAGVSQSAGTGDGDPGVPLVALAALLAAASGIGCAVALRRGLAPRP